MTQQLHGLLLLRLLLQLLGCICRVVTSPPLHEMQRQALEGSYTRQYV